MPTDSQISRSNATALIPEDAANEIIKGSVEQSVVLQLARRRPDMQRAQQRMPVLATFPSAYFVTGDTGLKQTTNVEWENVYLNAEELAVIVPVPESVVADTDYNIVESIMPEIQAAFGQAIDAAVLFGTNKPSSWPSDIVAGATAAGHTVALGTGADLYDDVLADGGTFSQVEADGYGVTGNVAAVGVQSKLRGLRDANGNPLFMQSVQGTAPFSLYGTPLFFPKNGAFDASEAQIISGDWSQLVYSFRQDLTMKVATEASITNASGGVNFNLFQQDMIAYRFVMRIAFALPNPSNPMNTNSSTRYPFSVLLPAS